VAMGKDFHAQSPYANHFVLDPAQCQRTVEWLMVHGAVFVADDEVKKKLTGMIGVAITPHLMSGEWVCGEVFWWVDPSARGTGLKLLRHAEQWGVDHGATVMSLVAPDARAEKLYSRLGFEEVESSWQRRLRE
jgi:GNAT superfamily N-acetyltransferase